MALLVAGGFACVSAAGGLPPRAMAQPAPAATGAALQRLSQAELEQLLAPIALYPDQLLMQVLMASTYPLEVVQAQRWLAQDRNATLSGAALERALVAQPWDPAVKSLVPFPQVLALMSEQLDWTQRLGDAVLGQQAEVLDSVQVLRGRALDAGKLADGPQQVVRRSDAAAGQPQVIVIQPAQPQQVYVPVYDPSVVYGPWPYPSYPPAYYPPPPSYGIGDALLTGMAFAAGVAVVGSLWGWARPGWGYGRGRVDVDVNRYNTINVNRTQINSTTWAHDGAHRRGVPYRDPALNDRYRPGGTGQGGPGNRPDSRDALRDRTQQVNRGGLEAARPGAGPSGTRPNEARRPDAARPASRPAGQDRAGTVDRPQGRPEGRPEARPAPRPEARPQIDRAQMDRARPDRQPAQRQDRAAPTRDRMPAAEARPVSRQQHGGGGEARAARTGGGGGGGGNLRRER